MVTQGPTTPLNGTQQVPTSLLRSNSGLMSGQGGGMPSQNVFPSLVSPHNQFNNANMLGNVPNISSLLHQSFGNNGSSTGPAQGGRMDGGPEPNPLSGVGTGLGFNQPSSFYANPSGQSQSQPQFSNQCVQMLTDRQQSQLLDSEQQFSLSGNSHQPQQSQGTILNTGPTKLEPQANGGNQTPQTLRNIGQVKLEPQQLQSLRSNLGPVRMEPQDPSLLLQHQQHLLSRQSPQAAAAASLLHQQRLMQMQHQQQQLQMLRAMPQQQRSPLPPQNHSQNLSIGPPVNPVYEPGTCARRLTHYMYQQQQRPEDNNIEFWREFVTEYFAPNAKKKWCVSMYGSGRQTTGVLPQDTWQCEICNRKPGRGFEATVEVLPRLFKVKFESGTLEELLYVDMPREYQNSSGQIVLDYAKAIQESVFEQLRIVREGQLRIVFSPDLKICSWEFCTRRHEELISRRLLIPQVSQLGAAAQKCQNDAQNSSSNNNSVSEIQNNCNTFLTSARQLAKALEVPLVNDFGYTKRYVRFLQISEVVNSMKDLIDYSHKTGTGPTESLTEFHRMTNPSSGFQGHLQQTQASGPSLNHGNPSQASNPQLASTNVNNTVNSAPVTSSGNTFGLLHQNLPQTQPTAQSSAYNAQPTSHGNLSGGHINSPNGAMHHQPTLSGEDAGDPQSSVQKIINDMMISSQLNNNNNGGGMMGAKTINGVLSVNNGSHMLLGNNGVANCNNPGFVGNVSKGGLGQSIMVNGSRANVDSNNSLSMNGRVGMSVANQHQQHHAVSSNQLLSGGLGAVNSFNNLQFDWKGSA